MPRPRMAQGARSGGPLFDYVIKPMRFEEQQGMNDHNADCIAICYDTTHLITVSFRGWWDT